MMVLKTSRPYRSQDPYIEGSPLDAETQGHPSTRSAFVGAVALLAVVFAGWAGTAAAQSFGFATFSAVVDADGTTARGSGVQNSARTATGSYIIIFTREVAECAVLAGPRGANGGQASVREVAHPRRIRVNTYSRAGQPANLPFVVLVSCAS